MLIVARVDRLGRSLPHLIEAVRGFNERGVDIRSLSEALETASAGGRMLFQIAASFAEYERSSIRERNLMDIAVAREQGLVGGRSRAMTRSSSPW